MKRTIALWAAVPVFCLAMWTADAAAQYERPTTTPQTPPQSPPTSAAGDTLRPSAPPPVASPPAATTPADTMTAAQRIRKSQSSKMSYVVSLGLGSSLNRAPDAFTEEYDPSFGFYIDGGVRRWELEATLSFDYNFFLCNLEDPDDLNIFNLFVNLKYRPLKTTARPYVLGCAGWFRSWIVNELDPANPPQTVIHEVEGGDNKYEENVFGYGVGGGIEIEMDKTRRIFFEGRYIQGQTRETQNRENMTVIPMRLGLTWEF
jgi:hypothetical protein